MLARQKSSVSLGTLHRELYGERARDGEWSVPFECSLAARQQGDRAINADGVGFRL